MLVLGAVADAPNVGAPAVAMAVEYALELQASIDLRARIVDMPHARHNLTLQVRRMVAANILAPLPAPVTPDTDDHGQPAVGPVNLAVVVALATQSTDLDDQPGTAIRLTAPPIGYDPATVITDGSRPGFSVAGYVARFTQVTDPLNPLDHDTVTLAERRRQQHTGQVLGQALFRGKH